MTPQEFIGKVAYDQSSGSIITSVGNRIIELTYTIPTEVLYDSVGQFITDAINEKIERDQSDCKTCSNCGTPLY